MLSQLSQLVQGYKDKIRHATPVGDYINDNIMGVTNMLCMEDRKKAFEVASNMGMNYYTSLAFHWLDNIPKPDGPRMTRMPSGCGRRPPDLSRSSDRWLCFEVIVQECSVDFALERNARTGLSS